MSVTVAELSFAPGKSMRGYENVDEICIDGRGLVQGDHEWMWVEAAEHTQEFYKPGTVDAPGRMVTQREDPLLTGIAAVAMPGGLELDFYEEDGIFVPRAEDTAENRIPVSVWGWEGEAVDQGDEAAEWGFRKIGRPVRLVALSEQSPRWVEGDPRLGRTSFADGFPITVGSTESFDLVNEYLMSRGRPAVPYDRTRTTMLLSGLVAKGTGEKTVFPDDYIKEIRVTTDGLTAVLSRMKACGRCPIPDTDQRTGVRWQHVRPALGKLGRRGMHANTAKYGKGSEIFWTENFIVDLPKDMLPGMVFRITRGSEVDVTMSDSTNWKPLEEAA